MSDPNSPPPQYRFTEEIKDLSPEQVAAFVADRRQKHDTFTKTSTFNRGTTPRKLDTSQSSTPRKKLEPAFNLANTEPATAKTTPSSSLSPDRSPSLTPTLSPYLSPLRSPVTSPPAPELRSSASAEDPFPPLPRSATGAPSVVDSSGSLIREIPIPGPSVAVIVSLSENAFLVMANMLTEFNAKIVVASQVLYDNRAAALSKLTAPEAEKYRNLLDNSYMYFYETEALMDDIVVDCNVLTQLLDVDPTQRSDELKSEIEQTRMDCEHCLEICLVSCKRLLDDARVVETILVQRKYNSSPVLQKIKVSVAMIGIGAFTSVLVVAECFGLPVVAYTSAIAAGTTTASQLVTWFLNQFSKDEAAANLLLLDKLHLTVNHLISTFFVSAADMNMMHRLMQSVTPHSLKKMRKYVNEVRKYCKNGKRALYQSEQETLASGSGDPSTQDAAGDDNDDEAVDDDGGDGDDNDDDRAAGQRDDWKQAVDDDDKKVASKQQQHMQASAAAASQPTAAHSQDMYGPDMANSY